MPWLRRRGEVSVYYTVLPLHSGRDKWNCRWSSLNSIGAAIGIFAAVATGAAFVKPDARVVAVVIAAIVLGTTATMASAFAIVILVVVLLLLFYSCC